VRHFLLPMREPPSAVVVGVLVVVLVHMDEDRT